MLRKPDARQGYCGVSVGFRLLKQSWANTHKAQRRQWAGVVLQPSVTLLPHTLDRDDQVDRLRSRAKVHFDVEVFQFQRRAALESGAVAPPRILTLANELGSD